MGCAERNLAWNQTNCALPSVGWIRIRSGARKKTTFQLMKQTANYIFMGTFLIGLIACISSESPTLAECRKIQTNNDRRIAVLDSALQQQLEPLRVNRDAISTDTLLATDSLLREQYGKLKTYANNLEFAQSELREWRSHLVVLPSIEEISKGIENPFGAETGDQGVLNALQSYSDSLSYIEQKITELIRTNDYERTPSPQP